MALVGPDALARLVEGEALFVVAGDDSFELGPADRVAVGGQSLEQRRHLDPAARREAEPDLIGPMAQVVAEPLADADEFLIHQCFPP